MRSSILITRVVGKLLSILIANDSRLKSSMTLKVLNRRPDCDKMLGFHEGDKIDLISQLGKSKRCNVYSTTPYFNSKNNKLITSKTMANYYHNLLNVDHVV